MRAGYAGLFGLVLLAGCSVAKTENYVINRSGDLVDIFRIHGMAGPGLGIKADVTQALQFGFMLEYKAYAAGLHDREVGTWRETVTSWGLFVGDHREDVEGIPRYSGSYGWRFGETTSFQNEENTWALDMLNIRGSLMFVVGLDVEIRLGELVDFVAGIFQFDPAGDDGVYRVTTESAEPEGGTPTEATGA